MEAIVEMDDLEQAMERAAAAEERATHLALELEAAHRRIADLQDYDYSGNNDPVIERILMLKSRLGKTTVGARIAPLYRKLTHR